MKNGKFEATDLDAKELIVALVSLLVDKDIIKVDEFEEYRDAVLEDKNKRLEKELSENQAAKFIFDMLNK